MLLDIYHKESNGANTRIHTNDANKNSRGRFRVSRLRRIGRGSERHSRAGFTLIELLVAIAVFSAMVTIVSAIFISAVGSQRKNVCQQDVLDNARFVLESMGRSIRQSSITVPAASGSGSHLEITHPSKGQVTYDLTNNQIVETIAPGTPIALSSSNVYISRLNFEVSGNGSTDNTQPRVTISISLRNTGNQADEQSYINLQTTVTPRNLQSQY